LDNALNVERTAWLAHLGPTQSSAAGRLICFPYAGGGPSVFMGWRHLMPREVEIFAVHLPGRETRIHETPSSSFVAAVDCVVAEVRRLPPLPTIYFGHSLGGLMAFETARRFEQESLSEAPLQLVLSGCAPPHVDKSGEDAPIWRLDDVRFIARLNALNGTPQELLDSPDLMELFMPMLRADFRLADEARTSIRGRISIPMGVFGGSDDEITREELQEWQRYATTPVSVQMFPGDHFFLKTAREALCAAVRRRVADTLAAQGRRM
jgi:medium-chain acyl-[acyl-carrier-protein] hydrolase